MQDFVLIKPLKPRQMNTKPIAHTMTSAIYELNKILSNETILYRNTKKLSELTGDEYDTIFNALVEVIEYNDQEFKPDSKWSWIQDFECEITPNLIGRFQRIYNDFTEDEVGNRYAKGDDYEDSKVTWWYNGEIVDLN
jgi:hypothetical protein